MLKAREPQQDPAQNRAGISDNRYVTLIKSETVMLGVEVGCKELFYPFADTHFFFIPKRAERNAYNSSSFIIHCWFKNIIITHKILISIVSLTHVPVWSVLVLIKQKTNFICSNKILSDYQEGILEKVISSRFKPVLNSSISVFLSRL